MWCVGGRRVVSLVLVVCMQGVNKRARIVTGVSRGRWMQCREPLQPRMKSSSEKHVMKWVRVCVSSKEAETRNTVETE